MRTLIDPSSPPPRRYSCRRTLRVWPSPTSSYRRDLLSVHGHEESGQDQVEVSLSPSRRRGWDSRLNLGSVWTSPSRLPPDVGVGEVGRRTRPLTGFPRSPDPVLGGPTYRTEVLREGEMTWSFGGTMVPGTPFLA